MIRRSFSCHRSHRRGLDAAAQTGSAARKRNHHGAGSRTRTRGSIRQPQTAAANIQRYEATFSSVPREAGRKSPIIRNAPPRRGAQRWHAETAAARDEMALTAAPQHDARRHGKTIKVKPPTKTRCKPPTRYPIEHGKEQAKRQLRERKTQAPADRHRTQRLEVQRSYGGRTPRWQRSGSRRKAPIARKLR